MIIPKNISIHDFTYTLPDEKIARYPVAERDSARLLIYNKGNIREDIYKNIHQYIPENSLLIFNDTKVIKARIRFQKPTGGVIEVFCLEPAETINEYSVVMNQQTHTQWKCMVGGAGKWKEGELEKELATGMGLLKARLIAKLADAYLVAFSWEPANLSFAEVIEMAGDIPLPPYLKRDTEITDTERYQTIYARDEGSVAAPTAGLHFTENIFSSFAKKNINTGFVTLHVGAGTFKPVKAQTMQGHEMHAEWIDVTIPTIENILLQLNNTVIAVGTTSLRTLESLYWLGLKAHLQPASDQLQLSQWEIYEAPLVNNIIPVKEALQALINWLNKNNRPRLFNTTQILIAPGYHFKIARALITNFHQPNSTLLLLVAAVAGNDWKKIYNYALQNNFRFLSYGDGSLLFINE